MFTSTSDNLIIGSFADWEAALLRDLVEQLIVLLEDYSEPESQPTDDGLFSTLGIGGRDTLPRDPALARLLPDAYTDDAEAAADHRRFTERALVERKTSNARTVAAALDTETSPVEVLLDPAEIQSWLRTLTDLRLTLASRLGIEHDGDLGGDSSEHAEAMRSVFDWLGYLQESLLQALEA